MKMQTTKFYKKKILLTRFQMSDIPFFFHKKEEQISWGERNSNHWHSDDYYKFNHSHSDDHYKANDSHPHYKANDSHADNDQKPAKKSHPHDQKPAKKSHTHDQKTANYSHPHHQNPQNQKQIIEAKIYLHSIIFLAQLTKNPDKEQNKIIIDMAKKLFQRSPQASKNRQKKRYARMTEEKRNKAQIILNQNGHLSSSKLTSLLNQELQQNQKVSCSSIKNFLKNERIDKTKRILKEKQK